MKIILTTFIIAFITFSSAAQTKFGVFLQLGNDNGGAIKKINVAKNLNIKYIREAIIVSKWEGLSERYEKLTKAGFTVIPNINYGQPRKSIDELSPVPFPTDLVAYKKTVEEILDKYHPELAVIENEEINKNYHSGPIQDYINMLKVAIDICHSKNIKVTNGGIYGAPLEILTYRYLQTKGQDRADSFANNCMGSYQIKAAQKPNSNPIMEEQVRKIDTLLDFYGNLDYVNIHLYEPFNPDIAHDLSLASKVTDATPVVIADIQEFIKARTGKQTMSNEVGQRGNTNPKLVTSVLAECARLKFPYVIWFSGEGMGGAKGLSEPDGSLRENGIAFKEFMKEKAKADNN